MLGGVGLIGRGGGGMGGGDGEREEERRSMRVKRLPEVGDDGGDR